MLHKADIKESSTAPKSYAKPTLVKRAVLSTMTASKTLSSAPL